MLRYRYIREDDADSLIAIWEDFARSPYAEYDVPHPTDKETIREMAKRWTDASPKGEHIFYAVCLDEEMIGYIDFHNTGDGYECGYCFHGKSHGRGYAKEAMKELMKRVADGKKTRFTAGTALNNTPSVRLLTSLGFEKVKEEPVSFYKDEKGDDIFFTGGVFVFDEIPE